jgi:hypothetical protein
MTWILWTPSKYNKEDSVGAPKKICEGLLIELISTEGGKEYL